MERPLQLPFDSFVVCIIRSFNPCFYGTTSSTFVAFFTSLASTSFNPCFYGTTSSTKGRKTQMATLVRFQSLFLWNDLFNFNDEKPKLGRSLCFNPCFYGTTSST